MPKPTVALLIGVLSLGLFTIPAEAQTVPEDSAFLSQARTRAESQYRSEFGVYLPVYQGTNWSSPGPTVQGSPFFLSQEPVAGELEYLGQKYLGIRLLYDAFKDKILVQTNDQSRLFALPTQKVAGFSLGDLRFIRPDAEMMQQGLSDTGFYQVLYPGSTRLLAKQQKTIAYQPTEDPPNVFVPQARYFLFNGSRFVTQTSQSDILSLRGKKSKALQRQLRSEKLRFKDNPEKTLVRAAEWYDQNR